MVDTDDTRRTTDDGRRTTPRVWHKLPTGELKSDTLGTVGDICMKFETVFVKIRLFRTEFLTGF